MAQMCYMGGGLSLHWACNKYSWDCVCLLHQIIISFNIPIAYNRTVYSQLGAVSADLLFVVIYGQKVVVLVPAF